MEEIDQALIESVLSRLDAEVEGGTVRMSVEFEAEQEEAEEQDKADQEKVKI